MQHKPFDKAGIWIAMLCALHCLLVPVVLPVLSLVGLSFLGFETFERILLGIGLLVGTIAIVMGVRHHQSPIPLVALIGGGALYFHKDTFGSGVEPIMIVVGASLLVIAHVLNLHLCRKYNNARPCEAVESELQQTEGKQLDDRPASSISMTKPLS